MADMKTIEIERLWELVKDGKSVQEIMAELDIRDMAALNQALHGVMQRKGEVVQVPGLIGNAGLRTRYTDQGIRIDSAMLEGSIFRSGDEFDLRVEGDRIVLKKSSQVCKRPPRRYHPPAGREIRSSSSSITPRNSGIL